MSTPLSNQDTISQVARKIWEKRGRPAGQDIEIWLEAEKQSVVPGAPDESDNAVRGSGKSQQSTTSADPATGGSAPTSVPSKSKIAIRKQCA